MDQQATWAAPSEFFVHISYLEIMMVVRSAVHFMCAQGTMKTNRKKPEVFFFFPKILKQRVSVFIYQNLNNVDSWEISMPYFSF